MKRAALFLTALATFSAQSAEAEIFACSAATVTAIAGEISGVSERQTGVLVTDNGNSFYALFGSDVFKSPALKERDGIKYGIDQDGLIFIKKDAVYSVSVKDTSIIFDECSEVTYG